MRYVALLLLPFAGVALAQGGNDRGPGIVPARQGDALIYDARDFTGVGMGFAGTVAVRTGGGFAVRATGPAAALANLRVARQGNALDITHRYRDRRVDQALERQVRFDITMPRIAAANLGGSGRLTVDRAAGAAFEGAVGGSGTMQIGEMKVERAHFSIGGSGNLAAAGTAGSAEVNIGGSGNVAAPNLRASSAAVSTAGSGSVRMMVDGRATVSMVGSGAVDLGPRAKCSVTRVGSGRVRCGG